MRNVAQIAEMMTEVPLLKRQKLAEAILQLDYIPQLVKCFETAEDLESLDDLHHLFAIFKGIVMLNSTAVYEVLLREDMLMGCIGALEHDPELRCHEVRHRAFLRDVACFRRVVPFADPAVERKVQQNFHLGFLKDVVLPRALDDNTFAALNQLQFFNNVQIVTSLTNDHAFLTGLGDKLAAEPIDPDALLLALRLLHELCSVTKSLQLYHRSAFYRKVVEHGYLAPRALPRPARGEPPPHRHDILPASTLHDPSLLPPAHPQHQHQRGPANGAAAAAPAAPPPPAMLDAFFRVRVARHDGEKPQAAEILARSSTPRGWTAASRTTSTSFTRGHP